MKDEVKSKLAAVSVSSVSLDGFAIMSISGVPLVLHASHGGRTFKIEEDVSAGFYVYAFEGEKCTHDSLQDTLALAKECAREEFGVPEPANRQAFRCVVLGLAPFQWVGSNGRKQAD